MKASIRSENQIYALERAWWLRREGGWQHWPPGWIDVRSFSSLWWCRAGSHLLCLRSFDLFSIYYCYSVSIFLHMYRLNSVC
jgi:hypothetical protein